VVARGGRTACGDRDGAVIAQRPVHVDGAILRQALERFTGEIEQVPPMHSALKHAGRPLYEYARQGIEIERKARRVRVHGMELEALTGTVCRLRVLCSKGFYVRALADDLGEVLGCGAHLSALRRLASGAFHIDQAVTLDALADMDEERRDAALLPPDAPIMSLPRLELDVEAAWQLCHGQSIWQPRLVVARQYRAYGPESRFLGVVEVDEDGKAAPKRLLAT
jgi:tRNA pseudouridine55 synthase